MGAIRQNLAIDLGSANIRICVENRGVQVDEPSYATINTETGAVLQYGKRAYDMLGKTDKGIVTIKPISQGAISGYSAVVSIVGQYMDRAIRNPFRRLIKPDIMTAIHCNTSNVGRRATERALKEAGAGRIFFAQAALAAAIGANLDISQPNGRLIVNIGADITDIAVISYNNVVVGESVMVGGNTFNEAIKNFFKKELKMAIGDATAEKIKLENLSLSENKRVESFEVSALEIGGNYPINRDIRPDELLKTLSECAFPIIQGISSVLEKTPPELVSDISQRGVVLTGGGSLLSGFDEYIDSTTGIMTKIADKPQHCVALGCMKLLAEMSNERKKELMTN